MELIDITSFALLTFAVTGALCLVWALYDRERRKTDELRLELELLRRKEDTQTLMWGKDTVEKEEHSSKYSDRSCKTRKTVPTNRSSIEDDSHNRRKE